MNYIKLLNTLGKLIKEGQIKSIDEAIQMVQKMWAQVDGLLKKGIENIKPLPGEDLFTTIELGLQRHMEKLMSKFKGVSLITDPLSGQILSFVSSPDFSPEIFLIRYSTSLVISNSKVRSSKIPLTVSLILSSILLSPCSY